MKTTLADNGFVWWIGVVENRHDPAKLGRCQVRIFGYHTDNVAELPSEDLPWAMIMTPATSAGISGVGTSPTGLVEGSWVLGFFLDGRRAQEPLIMGSLPGYDDAYSNSNGFQDPNGVYPRETGPATSPRARGNDPYTGDDSSVSADPIDVDLLEFIKKYEGFRARAYHDYKQYSIGYGTKTEDKNEVITKEEATRRLEQNVAVFRSGVQSRNSKYGYGWTERQLDGLTSFAYNLGVGAIDQVTDHGRRSNQEIANSMLLYNKAGGKVLNALSQRRRGESRMFLDGTPAAKLNFRPGTNV